MTGPTLDQIAVAQADARNMMKTTLGSDGPTWGTSPIIERYLVRLPLDNRCAHLRAVPLQPMILLMPTDLWRCRDCVAAYAANPLQLTDVEENTCYNCRRHFPGQGASFSPPDASREHLKLLRDRNPPTTYGVIRVAAGPGRRVEDLRCRSHVAAKSALARSHSSPRQPRSRLLLRPSKLVSQSTRSPLLPRTMRCQ
ncbi:hypothetical protein ACFWI0_25225 [[Kitasatospora] papulosa]|uniref:hypothetical protein n=1 Tax=[Kitasatospora] papulosa TaxID=1464011 RepID=UPI00324E8EB7